MKTISHRGFTFLLAQLLVLLGHSAAKDLIFTNVVWRHGDRSYMKTYPNDPYKNEKIWKNGPGQLTNTGMHEQYLLGRYLRSRYNHFLSDEYLRDEIYIRSTDKDRTIMSAQSNMAGLYPPTNTELWNGSHTTWQPIPIHVVPIGQDHLLTYPDRNCPEYNKIMSYIRQSPWYLKHEKEYSDFYNFIRNNTGMLNPCNLTNIWTIEDNLFCLKSNNYTLPSWATPEVVSTLKHLNSFEMGLMFTDPEYKYRNTISRMQGGVLLNQILKNMADHTTGEASHSLIAYSAHDTTLTALLVTLGSYDWVQPGYASCIMLELYENEGKHYVEMYYRKTNGTVTQMQFYDCDLSCSFEDFVKISQNLIPHDDHEKICGIVQDSHFACDTVFLVASICMFVLIMIGIAKLVYCRRDTKNAEYRRLENYDEA